MLILYIFLEVIPVEVATAVVDSLGTVEVLTDIRMDMRAAHIGKIPAIVGILSGKNQQRKTGIVDNKLPEFIRSV
jgi:hypothetical protein